MLPAKSYVIGLIEIDPARETPATWMTLAGDDETLDALLARLASYPSPPAAPLDPVPSEPANAGQAVASAQLPPASRRVLPDSSFTAPQRVPADLADLTAELADSLAEIRSRLAA